MPAREAVPLELPEVAVRTYPTAELARDKNRAVVVNLIGNTSFAVVPIDGRWTLLFFRFERQDDRRYIQFLGYPTD